MTPSTSKARLPPGGLTADGCNRDMPHRRVGLGAMPMTLAGLDMHDIAHIDLSLLMLHGHHAGARGYDQYLVAVMLVPSRGAALAEVHDAAVVVRGPLWSRPYKGDVRYTIQPITSSVRDSGLTNTESGIAPGDRVRSEITPTTEVQPAPREQNYEVPQTVASRRAQNSLGTPYRLLVAKMFGIIGIRTGSG